MRSIGVAAVITAGSLLAAFNPTQGFAAEAAAPPAPAVAYDARLTQYAYPYDVKMHRFTSQGQDLEMAYMHLPARDGKPTVLLLHGKNFTAAYWAPTARWLGERGYGVVMPDQIGFGKSSKPADYQYSFAQLARNTADLLDALHVGNVIVLGHSMGGMLATRFALDYRERTAKLILLNPIGLEDYLLYTRYPAIDAVEASELKKTPADVIAYQKKSYYDGKWTPEYEKLTEPLRGWQLGPDKAVIAKTAALTADMIMTQPVVNQFKDLRVPTALIIGTRDRSAPNAQNMRESVDYELGRYDRLGKAAAATINGAALYELDGLGHLPQVEDFARFAEVLAEALGERQAPE